MPSDTPTSWSITSMKRCPISNTTTSQLGPNNIQLGQMMSYNVEIEMYERRKARRITLNGVPSFLVEAFTWLEHNDAWTVEGIFRREGNINRMRSPWQIFCGLAPIPADCKIHDVCSLIKRFFREIRPPILGDSQSTIEKFADSIKEEGILLQTLLILIEKLPAPNFATIAFLMRQLKKVSDQIESNQMGAANLATVFAPSIFRDEMLPTASTTASSSSSIWATNNNSEHSAHYRLGRSLYKRSKRADSQRSTGSQDSLLSFAKCRNNIQVSVIQLLIENSHRIVVGVGRSSEIVMPSSKNNNNAVLSRKNSEKMRPKSPSRKNSEVTRPKSPPKPVESPTRQHRSAYAPSRRSKIWPRSASETPFGRTRISFNMSFGKNGSYTFNKPLLESPPVEIKFVSSPIAIPANKAIQPPPTPDRTVPGPSTSINSCSHNKGPVPAPMASPVAVSHRNSPHKLAKTPQRQPSKNLIKRLTDHFH